MAWVVVIGQANNRMHALQFDVQIFFQQWLFVSNAVCHNDDCSILLMARVSR